MTRRTSAIFVWLLLCAAPGYGQSAAEPGPPAKALNLSVYAELLRSDVRAQKVAILTEVVGFTAAEDKAFWPIYRECDLEMAKLGDQRTALIAEYVQSYATLTDAAADRLATTALELEARRQAVKGRCYERVKSVVSPRTALRFLQVEHQLLQLIDLQISALLPIAPLTNGGR